MTEPNPAEEVITALRAFYDALKELSRVTSVVAYNMEPGYTPGIRLFISGLQVTLDNDRTYIITLVPK